MDRLGSRGGSGDGVAAAARKALGAGIKDWIAGSRLQGGEVNGPNARFGPGSLMSTSPIEPQLVAALLSARTDPPVAKALARELGGAWKAWADGFQIHLAGAFPTLAAVPGPQAPPTPSARGIIPLTQGVSAGEARLKAPMLSASLQRAMPRTRGESDVDVDGLAEWLDTAFTRWKAAAHLQGLMGEGPVPTFAPPYVPMGPVIKGSAKSTPGQPAIGGVPFGVGIR